MSYHMRGLVRIAIHHVAFRVLYRCLACMLHQSHRWGVRAIDALDGLRMILRAWPY